MILRYLLFIAIVIIASVFVMILVKETGDSRKKLEKRLKTTLEHNPTQKTTQRPAPKPNTKKTNKQTSIRRKEDN